MTIWLNAANTRRLFQVIPCGMALWSSSRPPAGTLGLESPPTTLAAATPNRADFAFGNYQLLSRRRADSFLRSALDSIF